MALGPTIRGGSVTAMTAGLRHVLSDYGRVLVAHGTLAVWVFIVRESFLYHEREVVCGQLNELRYYAPPGTRVYGFAVAPDRAAALEGLLGLLEASPTGPAETNKVLHDWARVHAVPAE